MTASGPEQKELVVRGRVVWAGYELGYLCSCGRCYPVPGLFGREPLPELCHACGTLRTDMQKRALGVAKVRTGYWLWKSETWVFSGGRLIPQDYPMPFRRQAKRQPNYANVVPLRASKANHT